MLKLKLQYFGHLMRRADSLEKTPMLGKIEGRRRRGRQRMRQLDGITDSMDMSLSKPWEMVKDREAWHAAVPAACPRVRHDWATKQQGKQGNTKLLLSKTKCPNPRGFGEGYLVVQRYGIWQDFGASRTFTPLISSSPKERQGQRMLRLPHNCTHLTH